MNVNGWKANVKEGFKQVDPVSSFAAFVMCWKSATVTQSIMHISLQPQWGIRPQQYYATSPAFLSRQRKQNVSTAVTCTKDHTLTVA